MSEVNRSICVHACSGPEGMTVLSEHPPPQCAPKPSITLETPGMLLAAVSALTQFEHLGDEIVWNDWKFTRVAEGVLVTREAHVERP